MLWQMRYLDRHLEWDVRGNHLLENLRRGIDGSALRLEAERWLDRATLLTRNWPADLPHGAFRAFSDVSRRNAGGRWTSVTPSPVPPRPAEQCHVAGGKWPRLASVLHPDGRFLLGDACLARPALGTYGPCRRRCLVKGRPAARQRAASRWANWGLSNGGEMMLLMPAPWDRTIFRPMPTPICFRWKRRSAAGVCLSTAGSTTTTTTRCGSTPFDGCPQRSPNRRSGSVRHVVPLHGTRGWPSNWPTAGSRILRPCTAQCLSAAGRARRWPLGGLPSRQLHRLGRGEGNARVDRLAAPPSEVHVEQVADARPA